MAARFWPVRDLSPIELFPMSLIDPDPDLRDRQLPRNEIAEPFPFNKSPRFS